MLLDPDFDVTTDPVEPAPTDPATTAQLHAFVLKEARLLDQRRWDEWLALWCADSRYWMPRHHGQASPLDQISLFYEDRMLRETRVRRLTNSRNWSQQPVTHSSRLVGSIEVDGADRQGAVIVRSVLNYTEYRLEQRTLAGQVFHKLVSDEQGQWKLRMKRIDLVNCDGTFDNLEVFV